MPRFEDPKKLYIREKISCRTEMEGHVYSFDLRVEDITAEGILTTVPDLGGPVIEPGQEILVRYYRSDSAYQFLTRVLGYDEEYVPGPLLKIGFPMRITRFQRRRHARAEIAGSVRFYPDAGAVQRARGFIRDVSAGGVQFSTRQIGMFDTAVSPIGQPITVDLLLAGGHEFVGIAGRIRRVLQDDERSGYVRVQVEFTNVPPRTAERLALAIRKAMKSS